MYYVHFMMIAILAFMQTMKANLTVVADGCFSRFRKGLIRSPVSVSSHFMGIVMHNCPQFEPGHAEIVLSNTGPILIYQISSNATRILIDIQGNKPQNPKEYLQNCITSQLPGNLWLFTGIVWHICTLCVPDWGSCNCMCIAMYKVYKGDITAMERAVFKVLAKI